MSVNLTHAKLKMKDSETTVYGFVYGGTALLEIFATNPMASGASEQLQFQLHRNVADRMVVIDKAEFNSAFLATNIEDMDEDDKNASLADLKVKYPD